MISKGKDFVTFGDEVLWKLFGMRRKAKEKSVRERKGSIGQK